MTRIIKEFEEFSKEEVLEFADSFRNDSYEIVSIVPSAENVPQKLSPTLQDIKNIQIILEDESSDHSYFAIQYKTEKNEKILVPIGVYGIGHKRMVRFPLVINGIWISFLKLNKATFIYGLKIDSEIHADTYFMEFIKWKKQFIHKIFEHYYDSNLNSAMSWEAKGKNSNTRDIAGSVGFSYYTFNGNELFTSENIDLMPKSLKYFRDCLYRWKILSQNDPNPAPEINANTVRFVARIVNLKNEIVV